jgi:hypothetical protein
MTEPGVDVGMGEVVRDRGLEREEQMSDLWVAILDCREEVWEIETVKKQMGERYLIEIQTV